MTRIPADPQLPQLELALDVERMRNNLPFPRTGGEVSDVRISYIRYKHGTNCIVQYEASRPGQTPLWAYSKLSADPPPEPPERLADLCVVLPDERMVIVAFPGDLEIPSLYMANTPEQMDHLLTRVISSSKRENFNRHWGTWTPIRYKAERRCVLRGIFSDPKRSEQQRGFYARFYAEPEKARAGEWHRHFTALGTVKVPTCVGYNDKYGVLLVKEISGAPLGDLFSRPGEETTFSIDETARMLARWSQLPPPPGGLPLLRVEDHVLAAISAARSLMDGDTSQLDALGQWLDANVPDRVATPALLHGDFYYDQVLFRAGTARLLDLDEIALGDPLVDVANFCAHVGALAILGRLEESRADWIVGRFLSAYEAASGKAISQERFGWNLSAALLRLAVMPFRKFEGDWPNVLRQFVDRAYRATEAVPC